MMSIAISRADLIRLDAQDGAVDGTVTESQLSDFNQQFAEEAQTNHLFDEKGYLKYGRYLDAFGKGWSVWKGFAKNPEAIPLIDALRLGQKTVEIKEKAHVGFRTISGNRAESLKHLKNGEDLFHEWIGEKKEEFVMRRDMFLRLLKKMEVGDAPQPAFQIAGEEFLDYLRTEDVLKRGSKLDQSLIQGLRRVSVYEELSPVQEQEKVWSLSAALAYRSLYFFPAVADKIWGGAVESVNLSFSNVEENGFFMALLNASQNPYVTAQWEASTEGAYLPRKKIMQLPLHGMDNGETLTHEVGHAIWEEGYVRSAGQWFADWVTDASDKEKLKTIIHFFDRILIKEQYADVFGSDYGHPDSEARRFAAGYDPLNETHSVLATLADSGLDFPERIRDRLIEKNWVHEEIDEVYSNLSQFREIIKRTWGYEGPPVWAQSSF